jgi:hypothetical protein
MVDQVKGYADDPEGLVGWIWYNWISPKKRAEIKRREYGRRRRYDPNEEIPLTKEEQELIPKYSRYREAEVDYNSLRRVIRRLDAAMKMLQKKGLYDGKLYEELFQVLRQCNNKFVESMVRIGKELASR